jgi:thymidylate synthase (FAD)
MKTANMSVALVDYCGNDISIVNAARVSHHKESDFDEVLGYGVDDVVYTLKAKDVKLVNYLAENKHLSPFNHAFMSFRVKAPIFVARQLVKHKFLPWNEVSRRYVDEEPEFYFPEYWRKKAENVKQGSSDEVVKSSEYVVNYDCSVDERELCEASVGLYKQKLKDGCCPEQARMILPQNMMTTWIWSGTLGAFAAMCKLRLDPHTQKETQEVAQLISNEAKQLFPVSWQALLEHS